MYPKMIVETYCLVSNTLFKSFSFYLEIFRIGSNKKSCNEIKTSSHQECSFKKGFLKKAIVTKLTLHEDWF